jgi:quercetin dioxygenase-like cupin family protein
MTYVRLYAAANGESHFVDVAMPYHSPATAWSTATAVHSESLPARSVLFRRVLARRGRGAFHTAPQRQLMITLEGTCEVEASDGEARRFGPGSVLLVEDTTGKGHLTRSVGSEELSLIVVALAREP